MPARLLIAALFSLPLTAPAQNFGDGETIFNAKCSQCHTFHMARGMLMPKPAHMRPMHLEKFLKTHPPKLNDSERQAVVAALSRADR